jgi:hypothetical protein
VHFHTLERDVLEITAFKQAQGYGEHFKAHYDPTIGARANAVRNERGDEFDAAIAAFCEAWNVGTPEQARFEMEYLVAGGTRQ